MAQSFGDRHGAYLRSDVVAQLGAYGVKAAIRDGRLRPLWPRVLVDGPRVAEVCTRAAATLLAFGERGVLCGSTAALLYGCSAADGAGIHLLLPYGAFVRPRHGLAVHHGGFYQGHVVVVDGLRMLSLPRVVSDLLCTIRERDALAVADQAMAMQPPERREEFRSAVAAQLAIRQDPRGTRIAARLLGLATGRADSPPESWLRLLVADLGFPPAEVNWWLRSPDGESVPPRPRVARAANRPGVRRLCHPRRPEAG